MKAAQTSSAPAPASARRKSVSGRMNRSPDGVAESATNGSVGVVIVGVRSGREAPGSLLTRERPYPASARCCMDKEQRRDLDRVSALLAGADSDETFDLGDPDFPVTDLAGRRRLLDGVDHVIDLPV